MARAIDALPSGDVKPLKGRGAAGDEWRLRVGGWRVIYVLDREARIISVLAVRPRGNAYLP